MIQFTNVTTEWKNSFWKPFKVKEPTLVILDADDTNGDGTHSICDIPISHIIEFGFNKELDSENEGMFCRVKWPEDEKEKEPITTYYIDDFIILNP